MAYPHSPWNVEAGELARGTINPFRKAWDKRQAPAENR
jgi:hypothetical protein